MSAKAAVPTVEFVGFSRLEREKTVFLEELVSRRSDDIAKLNMDETLLLDLHERQRSSARGSYRPAWRDPDDRNQALRQLYGACHRGPGLRSRLIGPQRQPAASAAAAVEETAEAATACRQPRRPSPSRIRQALRPPQPPTPPSPNDGADGLAELLVAGSLTSAVRVNQLSREASSLVRLALANAEARLVAMETGGDSSPSPAVVT